jgi:two-component system KDP operon response regulator KdpE
MIKPIILVIEDEESIRNFITAILNSNGYQVIKTNTGKEGLSMAASYSPDVILLDLGLPILTVWKY